MRNAMVASSKKQATAMIVWLRLNPDEWDPIAYGDPIKQVYSHVKLIRPAEGVDQVHADWMLSQLVPNICETVSTIPPNWRVPQEHVA